MHTAAKFQKNENSRQRSDASTTTSAQIPKALNDGSPFIDSLRDKQPHFNEKSRNNVEPTTQSRGTTSESPESSYNASPGCCGSSETEEEDLLVRRLNALELSSIESTLPKSQQEANQQEQADEILALEAILGEDFIRLNERKDASQTFMVCITVETLNHLDVMLNLPSTKSDSDIHETSNGSQLIRACTLEFLPPINLIYRLPLSYPSHTQPNYVLSARWLSDTYLEKLCKGLDALWDEQVGNVVIYSWIEWLRTSCLESLGINCILELDSQHRRRSQDNRVFSFPSSPYQTISFMMRYNEEKKNESFVKSIHTCCICFSDRPGKDFIRLPCHHFFCFECMKQYVNIHVKEGTVKRIQCMDTSCKGAIPPAILKELLGETEFARWENLLLQKTLDSMLDVVYCPRCELVCIEDEDHHAQCSGCYFSFCSLCRGPRHVGSLCLTAEARLNILKVRGQGSLAGEERRRKELDYVNELMNLKYLQEEAKQCPACKMAIVKSEGCNKITCGNCGKFFCYRCNKVIEGYEHFREGCVLFDDIDIQRWEMAMNVARDVGPEAHRGAINLRTCPNCRQANFKEGNNNHIFCWSCQQHFCALCRKMVRRSSEHYGPGPNKCKQHTAD